MKIFYTVLVFLVGYTTCFSQASLVRNRLQAVALGKIEDVKRELPDLLAEFPDDPGIQFLHGVVLEDASRALKIYENIVKEHPECEWADDSQWRIVQFFALKRDTVRARKELKVYREKYPQSEFLLNASEMVKATVGIAKIPEKAIVAANETKVAVAQNSNSSVENKTLITKPAETKPNVNPAETKPTTKPAETKPTEAKPAEAKPTAKPAETKVTIKPIESKPTDTKTIAKADVSATTSKEDHAKKEVWSLQVGSYDSKETADAQVKLYKQKRLRATVVEKTTDNATKFAVFIGEYTSKESAEKAKIIVQHSCNCTPFVVVR
jgi:cell division septation protein DedD